jgi:phosphatidylglycerophosphate synthase
VTEILPAAALGKPESDGAFCLIVQRRISARLSRALAGHMPANAVTGLAATIGTAGAAAAAVGIPLVAAALVQLFGILSCVDGEVARLRRGESELGDLLDTVADRLVEVLVIAGITVWLDRQPGLGSEAGLAGLALMGSVLLLVVTSEKYRSSYGRGYPKHRHERAWSWVSAGSDARLLVLSIGLVAAAVRPDVLLAVVAALAATTLANFVWRLTAIARTAPREKP